MGLQYYSLLPWKWTWGHKSRVMTSPQSRGGENVLVLPLRLVMDLLYCKPSASPLPPHRVCSMNEMPPNAQPSNSRFMAEAELSIFLLLHPSPTSFCRSVTPMQPHRSQWFCTPKGVFSIGVICSNYSLNQRSGWRGHQAHRQERRTLSCVQAVTCCVAFSKPFSTAVCLSDSGYKVKGIFHCHTNNNKSRKRYRNLWKNTEAVHAGFTVWFPWQPPMLNIS